MADEFQQLIDAFSKITGTAVTRDVVFGSRTLRVEGICDGSEGVQRNAWVEWEGDKQMAYAGVNLEGKVYDGWPVARFIERELQNARLLEERSQVSAQKHIELFWYRDAWQGPSRPPIREKLIGGSPRLLHTLSAVEWKDMLGEAYACLDAAKGHRGRSHQALTTPSGESRQYPVSPHFQLRQPFWPRDPRTVNGWCAALDEVFASLRPLHAFVTQQAKA